jgi:hypothetical protein
VSSNNYVLFIILQRNIGTIKVENGMDIETEEDPVRRSNVVYVPSAFCVAETAPEVSFFWVSACFYLHTCMHMNVHAYVCVCVSACIFSYMSFAMSVSVYRVLMTVLVVQSRYFSC